MWGMNWRVALLDPGVPGRREAIVVWGQYGSELTRWSGVGVDSCRLPGASAHTAGVLHPPCVVLSS